jgi:uncharacterized membrane protein
MTTLTTDAASNRNASNVKEYGACMADRRFEMKDKEPKATAYIYFVLGVLLFAEAIFLAFHGKWAEFAMCIVMSVLILVAAYMSRKLRRLQDERWGDSK